MLHNIDLVCSQIQNQTFIHESIFKVGFSIDVIYNQINILKKNQTYDIYNEKQETDKPKKTQQKIKRKRR